MAFQVPAKVEVLFGSQTRAKVLGYLAGSTIPQTGYAISKRLEVGVSKVYEELKRLESSGVLVASLDAKGSRTFLLNDRDLRNFLVRSIRILPAEDWFSPEQIAERRKVFEETRRLDVPVPRVPPRAEGRPFANEFRRPPAKDRAMKRLRRGRGGTR